MKSFGLLLNILLLAFVVFGACRQRPAEPAPFMDISGDTVSSQRLAEVDTTLYGVAGDFGMSTFCLITDGGDTVLVTRSAEDGTDGVIYGDAQPGDRFCLITRDGGEALVSAINLTQLERHTKNYRILNGHLILNPDFDPDTVSIERLNASTFLYVGHGGRHANRVEPREIVLNQ